ncbi:retrovirus-related pol polyprotein from transposon TNT 1-94, partial [Tanacetum coccineum]
MIAPRRRGVYVLDMTSSAQQSCFFAKAYESLNWLWHKKLAHLKFKTINQLAKQNLVIGLLSLVYSKDKPCLSCEKSINHEKYTLVIVDEYSRISILVNFCDEKGCSQNFSFPYTPEQRGVAKRKNQTLIEGARTMLFGSVFSKKYWTEVVATACYNQNRYPPDEYLHPCEPSQRYQVNSNVVSFIEAYEKSKPVVIKTDGSSNQNDQADQNDHPTQDDEILNDDQSEHSNHNNDNHIIDNLPSTEDVQIFKPMSSSTEDTSAQDAIPILIGPFLLISSMASLSPQDRWSNDKHIELVNIIDFLSEEEPKKVSEALKHPGWIDVMQARLVAQGYNQQEIIDYDETFAPVAILEAIRIFLAFATYMNFTVYQMDVKSAFLNGKLKEEVYVKQSPGFKSNEFPNHVCKLNKSLYGLKQAPRAWYETLSTFLTEHKFVRGKIDNTLFVYKTQTDVIVIKQSKRGISINQETYVKDLLKNYDIIGSSVKTPMVPCNNLGPGFNELDLDADDKTFVKVVSDEKSTDEAPILWSALVGWEVISTPLGEINALYRTDQS